MRFLTKQENLRGTGMLHALVHIFVARSDAQAELEDSISRYGRLFMQTDWLFCILHWYVYLEVLWRLAKLKNLRGIDWLELVFCPSDRRLTRETSVDNPIC